MPGHQLVALAERWDTILQDPRVRGMLRGSPRLPLLHSPDLRDRIGRLNELRAEAAAVGALHGGSLPTATAPQTPHSRGE